jgi:DNA-binding transcriptional ArsR family regulator
MATVKELLRDYIRAVSDPTRGAIMMELHHAGELTATQLARRLGLTANNVYHHMRVLRELGAVAPPRVVPRETYVEKYYRVSDDLRAMGGSDPEWLDRVQGDLTAEDRKELFVALCLTMAQLLQRAARRYTAMDAEAFDTLVNERKLGMLSLSEMRQPRLEWRLNALRDMLRQEHEAGIADDVRADGEGSAPPRHVVLMAGLPLLWGDEHEEKDAQRRSDSEDSAGT